jgi:ATP synthase protein I
MVIELVAGIGIGFCIGYGLDILFGSLPVFLIAFVLLGFVAGVKTMLRTAQEVQVRETAKVDERKEG